MDSAGKSRVVYANVYNPNVGADTWDRYGHGNHVSGILGGNAAMSSGSAYTRTFRGIAPQVQFVNLRVLDGSGAGTDSMVIAAIQAAISLKSTYKIRIINMSLGRAVFESYKLDPLCQAVEQAWKAGIVVVVAAGNNGRDNTYATDGYGTITAPGNDPYVITVGAMNDVKTLTRADDKMASYSSKGPTLFDHVVKPDIVAPGNKIIAAEPDSLYLANNFPGNRVPESYYMVGGSSSQLSEYYFTLSGTSMAAPMVSGSAALLLQQTPSLTPDQVKARLMMTATKSFPASTTATDPVTGIVYTDYNDIFTVGAGYLDTWAALNNTDLATEPALSPTAVYNSTTGTVSLVNAANVIWGSNVIWGTNVIWGSSVVSAANVIWGTNAVWGSSTLQGFSAVWGSNVIWGSSAAAAGETSSLSINGDK